MGDASWRNQLRVWSRRPAAQEPPLRRYGPRALARWLRREQPSSGRAVSMAGPYGPRASHVVHKYLNNQSLVPKQDLDSADPDSIPSLLLPQLWRGGGCEETRRSQIGTRHGVAFSGRGGSGSRRNSGSGTGAQPAPALSMRRGACGAPASRARRDSEAGAATRSKGEPAYPMYDIGAGEGLRPLRTPDPGGVPPLQ